MSRPVMHPISFTLATDGKSYQLSVPGNGEPGDHIAVEVGLVDLAVLRKSALEIVLRADGSMTLDAMGLSEAVIAEAATQKFLPETDLVALVKACLDPRLLAAEDDAAAALAQLKHRLKAALTLVEDAARTL